MLQTGSIAITFASFGRLSVLATAATRRGLLVGESAERLKVAELLQVFLAIDLPSGVASPENVLGGLGYGDAGRHRPRRRAEMLSEKHDRHNDRRHEDNHEQEHHPAFPAGAVAPVSMAVPH